MKRLNFAHLPAEKSSMNKIDSFFVLILVLVSGLTVIYKAAEYDLGDARLLISENQKLQNKVKILELKQKDLELSLARKRIDREIASLPSGIAVELNPAKIAEELYREAHAQCLRPKKDSNCLDRIDTLISQFPDSKWAGKSLVLLTGIYLKEKNFDEAAQLVNVVRLQFKNQPEVLRDLKEFEKNQL